MQIFEVVATTLVRPQRTEEEKGFVLTALGHESGGPKPEPNGV